MQDAFLKQLLTIIRLTPGLTMSDFPAEAKAKLDSPEVWVDEYGDFLYRYALSRVKDPSTAEDLVQETFLAALKARRNFRGRSSARTWLIAILKHKIVDHIRKKVREQASDKIESLFDAAVYDSDDAIFNGRGDWKTPPAKWAANPTKLYEQKEFIDILYLCLGELPERQAKAFMMREIDGLSTDEICKALNISATNSWVILYRARMLLRQCLEIKWLGTDN
jgi:RNA polymerase sigma-70 factor (ECF subfamily)